MKKETIEYGSPLDALVAVAKRLNCHEGRYGMASEEFYNKYEKGQMQDSADFVEWANDYRHHLAIRLKIEEQLRDVA